MKTIELIQYPRCQHPTRGLTIVGIMIMKKLFGGAGTMIPGSKLAQEYSS